LSRSALTKNIESGMSQSDNAHGILEGPSKIAFALPFSIAPLEEAGAEGGSDPEGGSLAKRVTFGLASGPLAKG